MKKTIKVMAAVLLVMAMVFIIASCGVDMNKIKGDWTVSTVEGKAPLDYAKENGGQTMIFALLNYTITEKQFIEKTVDISGDAGTETVYDIAVKSDGFNISKDGNIDRGVLYDEKADTLSYKTKIKTDTNDSAVVNVVLKRGSVDLDALISAAFADAQGGEDSGEEPAEAAYSEEE